MIRNLKYFSFLLTLCFSIDGKTQSDYDFNWMLGQNGDIQLSFPDNEVVIDSITNPVGINFAGFSITLSDKDGDLIFYSNGCDIINDSHEFMPNGNAISPGIIQDFYCSSQFSNNPIPQGGIAIPRPGYTNQFYLFHLNMEPVEYPDGHSTIDPTLLWYELIEAGPQGNAVVKEKNIPVLDEDSVYARGQLAAVRHANGIDWWLVVPFSNSKCYNLILISQDNITTKKSCTGVDWNYFHGSGQASFSPNGEYYARVNPNNGVHIFSFDRCEGKFNFIESIPFNNTKFNSAGLSFSPNSEYLYVTKSDRLIQYNIQSTPIFSSGILIDSLDENNSQEFGASMFLCQLTPHNNIFISGTSSHKFLHIIENPDSMGIACDLKINELELPYLNFVGLPNFPNFNLGAAKMQCDTTLNVLEETSKSLPEINIIPNPSRTGQIKINFSNKDIFNACIIDLTGMTVNNNVNVLDNSTIDLNLPPGIYFLLLQTESNKFYIEKFIVL